MKVVCNSDPMRPLTHGRIEPMDAPSWFRSLIGRILKDTRA